MSVLSSVVETFVLLATILLSYIEVLFRLIVPASWKSVAGRTVLITGAGHGIGRLLALGFAREKAILVLWDINRENNEKTAREVRELGATAFSYSVDCTSHDAVAETAQKVLQEVGSVYMLINNAGILVGEDILTLTKHNITQTININVLAHFWTIRSFLPAMLEANEGHIVTIASLAGKLGQHRMTDYCASKFAVLGLHEALTDELYAVFDRANVHTTVVCPAFISTGLIHGPSTRAGNEMLKPEYVSEVILDGVLTNKREIVIPSGISKIILMLKALLPIRGWEAFWRYNDVRVPSQTHKDK